MLMDLCVAVVVVFAIIFVVLAIVVVARQHLAALATSAPGTLHDDVAVHTGPVSELDALTASLSSSAMSSPTRAAASKPLDADWSHFTTDDEPSAASVAAAAAASAAARSPPPHAVGTLRVDSVSPSNATTAAAAASLSSLSPKNPSPLVVPAGGGDGAVATAGAATAAAPPPIPVKSLVTTAPRPVASGLGARKLTTAPASNLVRAAS